MEKMCSIEKETLVGSSSVSMGTEGTVLCQRLKAPLREGE